MTAESTAWPRSARAGRATSPCCSRRAPRCRCCRLALAERDVAYRAENSSLVYAAPRDPRPAARPARRRRPDGRAGDRLGLRTPLFGCSDRDLYEWRVTHGLRWNWYQDVPRPLADHPVAVGLRCLGDLAAADPVEHAVAAADHRCRAALRARAGAGDAARPRCVAPRAVRRRPGRAWSEAGGHGVRHYLTWTRLQGDDGRFVAETVLPETDHDAVRVMTVHAAKGLEFPITIVSGLTTRPNGPRGRRVVWPPGTWTLTDPDDASTRQFAPIDEQMSDAERRRLLYVATTRAQDHLVVSLHRDWQASTTSAALLAEASHAARCTMRSPGTACTVDRNPGRAVELPWADERLWAATAMRRCERRRLLGAQRDRAGQALRAGRSRPTRRCTRTPSTSICRRGSEDGTARPSDGRCTRCCSTPT